MSTADANDPNTALQKATSADFSAGGLLSPEQFSDFMQDVQESARILGDTRMFSVDAPSGDIPRLDVPPRQLIAVQEATDPGQEASFEQPDVAYDTTKVSLQHEFSWESINEVIDDPESTIRGMFAQRFGADLEVLGSVGDTSGTGFAAIEDGWLTRATARGAATYDHQEDTTSDSTDNPTDQPIDNELFNGMFQMLPEKFKSDDGSDNLVYLASMAQKQAYKDFLTDRSTGAGDAMLMSGEEPTPYGREIRCPLGWPDGQVMLTTMDNLGYVVQDDVRTKTTTSSERNIRADIERIMAMYAKVDYVVLDEEGIVVGDGVQAPA